MPLEGVLTVLQLAHVNVPFDCQKQSSDEILAIVCMQYLHVKNPWRFYIMSYVFCSLVSWRATAKFIMTTAWIIQRPLRILNNCARTTTSWSSKRQARVWLDKLDKSATFGTTVTRVVYVHVPLVCVRFNESLAAIFKIESLFDQLFFEQTLFSNSRRSQQNVFAKVKRTLLRRKCICTFNIYQRRRGIFFTWELNYVRPIKLLLPLRTTGKPLSDAVLISSEPAGLATPVGAAGPRRKSDLPGDRGFFCILLFSSANKTPGVTGCC